VQQSTERRRTLVELLDVIRDEPMFDGLMFVTIDEHVSPEDDLDRTHQTASGGGFRFADQYTHQYGQNETLVVRVGPGFDPVTLDIGRSRSCQVRLSDDSVSSHHARLTVDRHHFEYFLTDVGSRNGTTMNGERLKTGAARQLFPGTFVSFGAALYLFLDPHVLRKLATIRRDP
jgi:hypothetical protein